MAVRKTQVSEVRPPSKRVTLAYHMPEAQCVTVTGSFCDWRTDRYSLKQDRKGLWKTTLSLSPGRYEYRFVVDGEWRNDPSCGERAANEFGSENCVLHV
jgi:1,4-alpha-glucan branching enzyme